jgi:hypothetical protein
MEGLRKLVLQCMWFRESKVFACEIFSETHTRHKGEIRKS